MFTLKYAVIISTPFASLYLIILSFPMLRYVTPQLIQRRKAVKCISVVCMVAI
jgi:hypothetical protein